MTIEAGDILRVGSGPAHGEFIAIVDHVNGAGQLYVIPIDRSAISPKYLTEQTIKRIEPERWTDDQFASYARWRDSNGIKAKHPRDDEGGS